MSRSITHHARSIRGADRVLLALRITSVLACLTVLYQTATVGELFLHDAEDPGVSGTAVLYVLTGLTAIAAAVYRRLRESPWWPVVVAAVVFAASFGQAPAGQQSALHVRVPLALALMTGATAVAIWALTAHAETERN